MRAIDHEIKTSVEDELEWTAELNADRIGVAVNDGTVILSGEVDSYPEKEAALRAALRVRKVTAVADEVAVSNSSLRGREDADIARDAGAALERDIVVPHEAVKVTVHRKTITLSGEVQWEYQRAAARRAVAAVPGVRMVINAISLKPKNVISAAQATSKITSAFLRNAQLDANRISVSVDGSVVTLRGTVSTWSERHQAEDICWSLPGVTDVVNDLTLSP